VQRCDSRSGEMKLGPNQQRSQPHSPLAAIHLNHRELSLCRTETLLRFRPGMTAFDQVAALNCYPDETRFLLPG